MRKYVVPIVALAGIALLSPHANAANLIIKSRAIPAGGAGSLPVSATAVSANELWGVDLAVTFADPAVLSAGTFASTGAAFQPQLPGATGASPTDVVVSGTSFVGTTKPSMYWGYVRGAAGMTTTASASGVPTAGIGLMKVQVAAGATAGTAVKLNVGNYDVKNDGTGNDVSRAASTGATSTGTTGAAVANEPMTVLDLMPGTTAPDAGKPDLRVPLHTVGVGKPGDLNADGNVAGSADLANVAAVLVGKAAASWTDYKKIAADVAPLNGYVPSTTIGGTAGQSYGDGQVGSADLALIAAKAINKATAANFPVPE